MKSCSQALNDSFSDDLAAAFLQKFGVEIETMADLFSSGKVSLRKDGSEFSQEQMDFIAAFELGYLKARERVVRLEK